MVEMVTTLQSASRILISVSIVSHGQAALIASLLADMEKVHVQDIEVILTLNIEETLPFNVGEFSFPLTIICNSSPKGFGANHNAAFTSAKGRYFCVLNPDIRFNINPLPLLVDCLHAGRVGVAAPLIRNPSGAIDDSARCFPTPLGIAAKILGRTQSREYVLNVPCISPDWVAGMFMLIPSETFYAVGGFDERYFLYYEDVDLCARMRRAGYDIRLCREAQVLHHARRQSHKEWRYRRWHAASILRFFTSQAYFWILWAKCKQWASGYSGVLK